jgi:hypothetical protein
MCCCQICSYHWRGPVLPGRVNPNALNMPINKRICFILLLPALFATADVQAQSASFNFTAFPHIVSGWTNVVGDPGAAVVTATSSTGVAISSVATANWAVYSGHCAADSTGENVNGFFPAAVLFNHWYTYEAVYNVAKPQLKLSGLSKSGVYGIWLTGSATGTPATNPTTYTVIGHINYGSQLLNTVNNSVYGAAFNTITPDSTGSVTIYVSSTASTAADITGLVVTALPVTGTLTAGPGIGQVGSTLALGDSITGLGPHKFISNRNQFLAGKQYSFGGSVNDPPNHPVFRAYDNGDLTWSTTMDRSVTTTNQTGLRYYAKPGYMSIGGSDRIDTTQSPIVYGSWPSSGIFINSAAPNTIKGKIMNGIFAADNTTVDSGIWMENNYIGADSLHFSGPTNTFIRSFMGGHGNNLSAPVDACLIDGQGLTISKLSMSGFIVGYGNATMDTTFEPIIGGVHNQFGGLEQLVAGQGLINRTPAGTTLGNYNTDFSTLSYTGLQGTTVSGIAGYPLFVLGNSASNTGSVQSNALTVLYNGRTQINTTGHTTTLTQANVTPQAALDVVSTNSGVLLPRLTTTQRNAIISGDLQNGLFFYNTDSSAFQYYTGSAWKTVAAFYSPRWSFVSNTVFDSTDNLAIGTGNAQGYKLAVNGSVIFVQMVVKNAGSWPDYVFRQGYRLAGLDRLAAYVQVHHHLPGIEGERQVAYKGLAVGEQQAAMLKTAEELTLYLFRQNDELREQNRLLSEQSAKLEAHQQEIDQLKELLKSSK